MTQIVPRDFLAALGLSDRLPPDESLRLEEVFERRASGDGTFSIHLKITSIVALVDHALSAADFELIKDAWTVMRRSQIADLLDRGDLLGGE